MNQNLAHLYFVLDRSGSMQSIKSDTEGGFDAFILEQRKISGECRVTLSQFDDQHEVVYEDLTLAEVPPLALQPRGSTALFDAIGRTINMAGTKLSTTPERERPSKVVVIIMTDGQENASREFNQKQIKEMIERQENIYSWQFVYLGANQDAVTIGSAIGVGAASSMTFAANQAGAQAMYSSLNESVRNLRSGKVAKIEFSESDREEQAKAGIKK